MMWALHVYCTIYRNTFTAAYNLINTQIEDWLQALKFDNNESYIHTYDFALLYNEQLLGNIDNWELDKSHLATITE